MNTDPYMHNGLFDDIMGVINIYNSGMHRIDLSDQQKSLAPHYPVTDPLLEPLDLTQEEKGSLIAFLESITVTQ